MIQIIGGKHRTHKLLTPNGQGTRPSSSRLREMLFNVCAPITDDARVLDLFAGSGAIGLEALSRGAAHCHFVENGRDALKCIKANIKSLGLEVEASVLPLDALRYLKKLGAEGAQFDLIYADPPYGQPELAQELVELVDLGELLAEGGLFFLEQAASTAFEPKELKHIELMRQRRVSVSTLYQFRRP